jgi:hypothetical protein
MLCLFAGFVSVLSGRFLCLALMLPKRWTCPPQDVITVRYDHRLPERQNEKMAIAVTGRFALP